MTDTAPTHAEVVASIISARGGRSAFSVEQAAAASALGHLLCGLADGDPAGAASIPVLMGMLPPVIVVQGEADPRLRLLSDTELGVLRFLVERLNGRPAPDPSAEITPWGEAARLRRDLAALEERASRLAHENTDLYGKLQALEASQQQPPPPAVVDASQSSPPSPPRNGNVVPFLDPGGGSHPCLFDAADPSGRNRGMP